MFAAATKSLQCGREPFQSHHARDKTALDGGLWHTEDHTRFFALCDSHAAGFLYRAQTLRAIVAHTGHQYPDCERAEFFSHALEQNIRARPMTIDPFVLIEDDHVS